MVPHTYPTIEGRLVLGVITDITGLNEWQDYIPVVAQTNPVASSRNTFANDGYMGVNVLSSLTGLNAWIDYIPCYVVTGRSSPFSVSPDGYISVSAEVGTLGGASLADYIINSKTPDLVADFNGSLNTGTEFYDAGGTADTFAELITHGRAGNATMTDGYGPELWTDPAQTLEGPWVSAGSGVYTIDGSQSGTVGVIDNDFVVIGKAYSITYTVSNRSAGSVTGQVGSTGYSINSADGTYTEIIVATATNKPRINANSSFIGTVSKISVREVPAIKWAPHNFIRFSEDVGSTAVAGAWNLYGGTTVESGHLAPDGTNTAFKVTFPLGSGFSQLYARPASGATALPFPITQDLYVKQDNADSFTYGFYDYGTSEATNITPSTTWEKITATRTAGFQGSDTRLHWIYSVEAQAGLSLYIWHPTAYRSDLGGMVDNPDRADSYVPTTSSVVYLPRRNHHVYNGDAWVNEGVLHESEARANLATYSEDFSQWASSSITLTANSIASPTGSLDATLVTHNTAGYSSVYRSITTISGNTFTASVYGKAGTSSKLSLEVRVSGLVVDVFDLLTGTVEAGGTGTGTIEDVGNGWYRCSTTRTATASSANFIIGRGSSGTNGDTNYIWGAQIEEGSTPSSYIPTNSATVTRAAETLTIPAANMPWPEPNYIGPELVVNGGFSTDSNWVKGAGWSISNSTASHIAGTSSNLLQAVSLTTGKLYRASCDVVSCSGGSGSIQFRDGGTTTATAFGSPQVGQTVEVLYIAAGNLNISITAGSLTNLVVDNISVREIDPLSVSIQMQGRMTYADTGNAELTFFDWREDSYNYIQANLRTQTTATGEVYHVQAAASVTDDVDGRSSQYTPGVFVPFNTASRHGSTFINGAVDGVALTADTTPVALPDLSATDFNLGYDYMGTISMLRVWADDLADVGIAEATEPSEVPSLQLTFDNSETSFTIQDWEQ